MKILRTALVTLMSACATFFILTSFTVARADQQIKLIAFRGFDCPPISGCYGESRIVGSLEAQNLDFEKNIRIVYFDYYRQEWRSSPAIFSKSIPQNKELWTFNVLASVTEFALSYTVKGRTFWDNNHQQNYPGAHYGFNARLEEVPVFFGPEMQWKYVSVDGQTWASGYDAVENHFVGSVWIKNPNPNSIVEIVYTDDAWITVKKVPALPVLGYSYQDGTEMRSFRAPTSVGINPKNIEFAVRYQRDQQSFWDNNFGENFKVSAAQSFSR